MILKAYAVFDVKSANYGTPFFFHNDAVATRNFTDLANDPQSRVSAHPGDYSLFAIGEYDDNSGSMKPAKPVQVVQASSLIKAVTPQPALPGMAGIAGPPMVATKENLNGKKEVSK